MNSGVTPRHRGNGFKFIDVTARQQPRPWKVTRGPQLDGGE